jgi:hypothetical protein
MLTEIILVKNDGTEEHFASVDLMPEGVMKEEIKKILLRNPKLKILRKICQHD